MQGRPGGEQPLVGGGPAAGDHSMEGLEHEHAAGTSGVHDPGVPECLQLVGGPRERLLGGVDGRRADVVERATGIRRLHGCGGAGVGHGEDRALLRVCDAGARGGGPTGEGVGEEDGVDGLRPPVDDGVAQPADELADDDPRVAPRGEQDRALERAALVDEGGLAEAAGGLVHGDDLVDRRVEGEVEVGAGVAVGHREDVEGVDLGAPSGEGRPGQQRPVTRIGGGEEVRHAPQGNWPVPPWPGGVLVAMGGLGYA